MMGEPCFCQAHNVTLKVTQRHPSNILAHGILPPVLEAGRRTRKPMGFDDAKQLERELLGHF